MIQLEAMDSATCGNQFSHKYNTHEARRAYDEAANISKDLQFNIHFYRVWMLYDF